MAPKVELRSSHCSQQGVDGCLEGVKGIRPNDGLFDAHELALLIQCSNDERWGAADLHLAGLGYAALDDVSETAAGYALIQLGHVQPEFARPLIDVCGAKRSGIPQQTIVHLPEFALLGGAMGGARGRHRTFMEGQRHVTMKVFHLAGVDVVVADLRVDVVLETPAEGALEVGVFDNGECRAGLASERFPRDSQSRGGLECGLTRTLDHLLQLLQTVENLLLLRTEPRYLVLQFDEVVRARLRSVRPKRHQQGKSENSCPSEHATLILVDAPALVVIAGARIGQDRRAVAGASIVHIQTQAGVGGGMQLVSAAAARDLPCLAGGPVASLQIHG